MKAFQLSATSKALIALGLSASMPMIANAETDTTQRYFSVMGTYSLADDDRGFRLNQLGLDADADQAVGISVLYGWQFPSNWGVEAQLFSETIETDVPGVTDFYRHGVTADLTYSFGDRTGFTPFALLGVGGNYNDVSPNDDEFDFVANAGLGFVTGPVFKYGDIRLRAEARYMFDTFEDEYGDVRFGLGIEIPLSKKAEPLPELPPPQPQVVEVPTGLLDDDGDGVINDRDQCPDTPAGERVDGVGCPLGNLIPLNGVTFEFDKTRLRPDAETILDLATLLLNKYPDMQVEVAGHTDSKGAEGYNQELSEARANAVREYFVGKGVSNTITARGYGEAEPIADNDSEAGRERNRRVELRILN